MLKPILLFCLAGVLLNGQQGTNATSRKTFDFKGDALGEDFDQFSSRHKEVGIECSGDADLLSKHGLKDKYEEIHRTYGIAHDPTHTLTCNLKNTKQTVAGAETYEADYEFFSDKLYLITLQTHGYGGDAYRDIKAAYVERFGTPQKVVADTYQNGFGAVSYGEHCLWIDPDHPYTLTVTDGPNHEYAAVEFVDTAARQEVDKLRPKKTGDT